MVFLLLLLIFGFYSFAPTIGDGCSGDSGIGNPTTCEYTNQEQDPSSGSNSGSGSGTGSPQGGSGGNINGNSSYSARGNFSSNVSNNDYWIDLRLDSAISWNVTLVVDGVSVNSSVGSGSSNVSLGYTHPVSRNSTYRFRVNYSVGGSSAVAEYGPYNAYVDFVAPDVNVT
ncbi:MAG: hypothetical protein QXD88_01495, partial [Candidatus Anstonellales archaeon]